MNHILVVEDEEIIRTSLKRLLEKNLFKVSEADSLDNAKTILKKGDIDLIITDLRLPGGSGNTLIAFAKSIPVLVMTSYASLRSAVESMKLGAKNYIAKPFNQTEILNIVRETLAEDRTSLISSNPNNTTATPSIDLAIDPSTSIETFSDHAVSNSNFQGIIGQSKVMQSIYRKIERVAPTDTTVLILGESGTGKELVAKALHQGNTRKTGPLISVNCAAIPESLIESELFGHEKGAFTGANTSRIGLVEAANGGTLFLDEVGELPLEAQARLLRLLQEKEIRKVGAIESHKIDVRLVAATHRDLKKLAAEGRFREDLFYRLHVVELKLPPLRERGEDIIELADFFINKICSEQSHLIPAQFSTDALNAIRNYRWPGNVRELENAIERALILCDENTITRETLGIDPRVAEPGYSETNAPGAAHIPGLPPLAESNQSKSANEDEELSLEDYFQRFVLENQDQMTETQIAQKLGISRKCLWERRQRLGIPRKRSK